VIVGALLAALTIACGKKGPPLPPLTRVPAPVNELSARRLGDEVFLTFQVPSKNVDGSTPADIARVDVFALTTDTPPPRIAFLERGTRIATFMVSPPASDPARQPSPNEVAPGAAVTLRDTLSGDALVPVTIPPEKGRVASAEARSAPNDTARSAPGDTAAGAPTGAGQSAPKDTVQNQPSPAGATASGQASRPVPRRYYIAVASSARQRSSPAGGQASVAIAASVAAPTGLAMTYDERVLTLSWQGGPKGETYNVYRQAPAAPGDGTATPVTVPRPLNGSPLDVTTYRVPVEFNQKMCFQVRAVHVDESRESLEGIASEPPVCESPIDMFPPAAPTDLRAAGGTGEITLQWLPNAEPDLAGYLILRGAPGDATLAPITTMPITPNRYVDRSVMPGVRYVYAVVAVDNAPDANRSQPSARDEATAR
jgi:hypothetical protein